MENPLHLNAPPLPSSIILHTGPKIHKTQPYPLCYKKLFQHPPSLPPQPIEIFLIQNEDQPWYLFLTPALWTMPEIPINLNLFFLLGSPVPAPLIRQFLLSPKTIPEKLLDVKMISPLDPHHVSLPAHIPDMSDLAKLPSVLQILLSWSLKEGLGGRNIIQEELQFLLDPRPILPHCREIFLLTSGYRSLTIGSYTNELKLIRVAVMSRQVEIWADWKETDAGPWPAVSPVTRRGSIQLKASKCNWFCKETKKELFIPNQPFYSTPETKQFSDLPFLPANMTTLFWNTRGIGRPSFKGHLKHLIHTHHPDIVVLAETRVSASNTAAILRGLPFDSYEIVPPIGFSGGIILLWNSREADVTVVKKQSQFIHAVVQGSSSFVGHMRHRPREKGRECSC